MKSFFERNGGTYTRVGDFLIPDLVLNEQPEGQIGKYGRMRLACLKKWKKGLYNDLLQSGKLQQHLLHIDRDAREEFETIVRQTAKAEGVTEEGVDPILTIRVFAVGIGVLIAPFLASIARACWKQDRP